MRGECREQWETLASAMNVMLCYKTRGCRDLVMCGNRGDGGGTCMWIHDAHAEGSESSAILGETANMEIRGLLAGGGFMGLGDSGKWTVGMEFGEIDRAVGERGGVDADWGSTSGKVDGGRGRRHQ